jgi:hypothetical protein
VTAERAFVLVFFLAVAAYAIFGIVSPGRLVSREREFEPLLPYWMRDLFVYRSEKKVRRACALFLAIAIAGVVTLSASK